MPNDSCHFLVLALSIARVENTDRLEKHSHLKGGHGVAKASCLLLATIPDKDLKRQSKRGTV